MIRQNEKAPVVSSLIYTCALPLFTVCIASLLFSSGCATHNATITLHFFGGRSMQEGERNEMEAPSDVHDIIGDLDVPVGPQELPDFDLPDRGGGENSPAIKPEEVAPPSGTPSQLSPPPTSSGDRYNGDYPDDWDIVKDGPSVFTLGGYPMPTSRFRGRENETYTKPESSKILMPAKFVKFGKRWYIKTGAGEIEMSNTTRFVPAGNVEALPNDGRVHLFKSGLSSLRGRLIMEDIDGGVWSSSDLNFGNKDTDWDFALTQSDEE